MQPEQAAKLLRLIAGIRSNAEGLEAMRMGAWALERIAILEAQLAAMTAERDELRIKLEALTYRDAMIDEAMDNLDTALAAVEGAEVDGG